MTEFKKLTYEGLQVVVDVWCENQDGEKTAVGTAVGTASGLLPG